MSIISYEQANSTPVVIAAFGSFLMALFVIGYCALKLKDNGWRFSISMMLALIGAVALICMFVKILMIMPPGVK